MWAVATTRRRPGAPPWCGCCSSPTPVLGAAALEAAWGSSLDFFSARGGVAGHEQSGAWSSTTAPVGSWGLGPSEARCAPLVRLLLLSDPGSWCSGTGRGLGQLPGLFSTRGVVAHGQLGVEQHESPKSPRGQLKRGEMGPKATIFKRDRSEMLVLFFALNRELGSWINLNQDPGSTFEMHVLIYFSIKIFFSIIKIPDIYQK